MRGTIVIAATRVCVVLYWETHVVFIRGISPLLDDLDREDSATNAPSSGEGPMLLFSLPDD